MCPPIHQRLPEHPPCAQTRDFPEKQRKPTSPGLGLLTHSLGNSQAGCEIRRPPWRRGGPSDLREQRPGKASQTHPGKVSPGIGKIQGKGFARDSTEFCHPCRETGPPSVLCPLCRVQLRHPVSPLEFAFWSKNGQSHWWQSCVSEESFGCGWGGNGWVGKEHGGRLGGCQIADRR